MSDRCSFDTVVNCKQCGSPWRDLAWLVRCAWPGSAFIAVLHAANLLAVPLALFALGTSVPWYVPLGVGLLVGAARGPLRWLVRERLRPGLFVHAARQALLRAEGGSEVRAEGMVWGVALAERTVLDTVPTVVASAMAAVVTVSLAASRLGVRVVVPFAVFVAVLSLVRGRLRRYLRLLLELEFSARRRAHAWLMAATRDVGEICAGRARVYCLGQTESAARTWAMSENRRERAGSAYRTTLGGTLLVGVFLIVWMGTGQSLESVTNLLGRRLSVATVSGSVLLFVVLPTGLSLIRALDEVVSAHDRLRMTGLLEWLPPERMRVSFPSGPALLIASGVTVHYGDHVGLRGVSFTVPLCGLIAVIGPNGSGKSTLVRALAGVLPLSSGSLTVGDVSASELDPNQVVLVPQNPLFIDAFTIAENVKLVAPEATESEMATVLRALGLEQPMDHPAANLSRGEQRRVAVARALLRNPRLLILDEPDAWLDLSGRRLLAEVLKKESQLRAIVLVSHRSELVRYADRVIVLSEQRTVEAVGVPSEVMARSRFFREFVAQGSGSADQSETSV